MLKGFFSLSLSILLVVVVVGWTFGTVITPGNTGIRQISFGPLRGFSATVLPPGYHWSIPLYSKILIIPQTIQILNLDRDQDRRSRTDGEVEVQTTDGSSVDVDLSVLTRFFDEPGETDGVTHGGPRDLIQKLGPTPDLWLNTVARVSIDEVRRALGKLSTSQFYNPLLREQQMHEADKGIRARLAEFGIGLEAVLVRRYTYREGRIDKAIFDKNLQDQEERLNLAASKLSEAKALSEQVAAEMDAKIQTLKVEGENKARVVHSEGELYQTQKIAEGDLLVAKATAEVDTLKANLLAKTEGTQTYVAKELAPLLGSLKGGVVNDLNPYDMDEWVRRLGLTPSSN